MDTTRIATPLDASWRWTTQPTIGLFFSNIFHLSKSIIYPRFRSAQPPKFSHAAVGTIYNKNTIEEFKALDKVALLADEGKELIADMRSGRVLVDPSLLARFFVLSFADLKSHSYYYWFAFPCPLTPTLKLQGGVQKLRDVSNNQKYTEALKSLPAESQAFFILYVNEKKNVCEARKLNSLDEKDVEHYYFGFADPSEYDHPAWLMRNYAAWLLNHWLVIELTKCIAVH